MPKIGPEKSGLLVSGVKMNQQIASRMAGNNGESTARDLFALTDEQILEIEPEAHDLELSGAQPPARTQESSPVASASLPVGSNATAQNEKRSDPNLTASPPSAPATEPPPWLATQMKDPWSGEEARELWNGVQQARQEAAAYRAAFATPEDARALKQLYPGGVNEARAAAERARALDDIDRAYFGVAGGTPEQTSAARGELAQRMLREDPAAFREMVFAGLRALEAPENQSGAASVGATLGSPSVNGGKVSAGGTSSAPTAPSVVGAQHAAPQLSNASTHEAHVAAYAAFEKAANDDLERSVGATIERTLVQALPNLKGSGEGATVGARHVVPLRERLGAAVRQDVEAALKGDRQLNEQVAQILSGRRLDDETRIQVVRLIGERAQQLVPVAAKRVLNDWTQSTLAAHRSSSARADAASTRREVPPASSPSAGAQTATRERSTERSESTNRARGVDYRKLSDEQILDL